VSDSQADRRKAVISRFYEAFSSGNGAIFDEILSRGWTDHPVADGQLPGAEGLKDVLAAFREAFEGLIITPQVMVAEGDYVVARTCLRGIHARDWAGFVASHKPVAFHGMDMHRFRGDLIVETWHFEDYGPLSKGT
jgi:predicted ester cyclase